MFAVEIPRRHKVPTAHVWNYGGLKLGMASRYLSALMQFVREVSDCLQ